MSPGLANRRDDLYPKRCPGGSWVCVSAAGPTALGPELHGILEFMGPNGQVGNAVSTSVHADRDKLIRLRASQGFLPGEGTLPSDSLMRRSRHRHVQRLGRETDTIGRTRDGGPNALTGEAEEGGRSIGRLRDDTRHTTRIPIRVSHSHSHFRSHSLIPSPVPSGPVGQLDAPLRSSETQMPFLILPPPFFYILSKGFL